MIRTRIAEIVQEKGITNKSHLSRMLDMNRNGINRMMSDDEPALIKLLTIEKLCRTLNVLPTDLFMILNEDGTEWKPE